MSYLATIIVLITITFSTLSSLALSEAINSVSKVDIISKKKDSIKESAFNYCKAHNSLFSINNSIFPIDNLNLEGKEINISYDTSTETITISSEVEDLKNQALYTTVGYNCSLNECSYSFRMDSEDISLNKIKSKCAYSSKDTNMKGFINNVCQDPQPAYYSFANSDIEDTLHLSALNCSRESSLEITDSMLNGLDFSILRESINVLDFKNQPISNLNFLEDIELKNAYIDIEGTNITDISILNNKSVDSLNIKGLYLTSYPTLKLKKLYLDNSTNTDLSSFDLSNIKELSLKNVPISALTISSEIESLNLEGSDISSLSSINTNSLKNLNILSSFVQDLTPLCINTTLESFQSNAVSTKCAIGSNFCSLSVINNNPNYCQ